MAKRSMVEVNLINTNLEIYFKDARSKIYILEINHESEWTYYRTTELLSFSCFLVVMTLKNQRRVLFTIQTNIRQKILFKRKLRVMENNRYESGGPGQDRTGHRNSAHRTLSPPLPKNLQKTQKTWLPGSISMDSSNWSPPPLAIWPLSCTLMKHLWPRSLKIPNNVTKSPNPQTNP